MKSIDQIITACEHCIGCKSADSCYGCPYEPEDKCYDRLCEDVIFTIKRLRKLETPTEKEQPELPGITCFRVERDSRGKVINTIPITHAEYQEIIKEQDHEQTEK